MPDPDPQPIGARALTDDDLADAKTTVKRKREAAVVVPQALGFEGGPGRDGGSTRPRTGPVPLMEPGDRDEPRFMKDSRPLARPSSPKAVVGAEAPRSSWMPLAVASAIGLLAAAGVIYFFVVKPNEEPGPRTRPGVPAEAAKPTPPPGAAPTVAVAVTSTPAGAALELDGEAKGQTPTKLEGLDPSKTYKLVVKTPCYKEEAVDLLPKDGVAVDVKLAPLERVLRVATQPDGAKLSINGKAVGRAPSEVKMGTAPQAVRAVLPGYAPSELTVPVDAPCVTDGNVGAVNVKVMLAEIPTEAKPAPPTPKPAAARPEPKPENKPEPKTATPKPRPTRPPAQPPKEKDKAVIVSPLQPLPTAEEPPKAGPSDPALEPPKDKPPEPAVEPPKDKPPEAPPPKETTKVPAPTPVKDKPTKEKIAPPREQPLPNKECDPSPEAPEWARCK